MKKSYIFAILAFVFIAITAVADVTYICEDVGDWDQFQVPESLQQSLVDKKLVMEITVHTDGYSISYSISSYYSYAPNNYLNACKGKDCATICKETDYPDHCTCLFCSHVTDVIAVCEIVDKQY